MAKKSWHKKHISTRWGILILAVSLLAVFVLVPFLKENQDIRSNASVNVGDGGSKRCKGTWGSRNPVGCGCNDKVGCQSGLYCKKTYGISGVCTRR